MVRRIKFALFLAMLFALLAQPVSAATTSVTLKVTLTAAKLIENNHVGNEWYTEAKVNGKAIKPGATVTLKLKPTDSVKLYAYAEEQDKIPEHGSATASVKASSVTKPVTKTVKITVVENRGRYSGNTADWGFTFQIRKA